MANTPVVVLDDTMTSIANAIRTRTGGSATMTPGQMPAQIASIPSGGGTGITREVDANGKYGYPTQSFSFSLPSDATDISNSALYYAFSGCTSLTSVNLSSLATASGDNAFNYAFKNCYGLASVALSSLTTVSGNYALQNAFQGCTSLASVSFPVLTTVSGSSALYRAFSGCTNLTSVSFPDLTTSSFGSRTNQFSNMLSGCSGVTVHFPASTQTKIETMSDYPNFGGTNTTVLFDL